MNATISLENLSALSTATELVVKNGALEVRKAIAALQANLVDAEAVQFADSLELKLNAFKREVESTLNTKNKVLVDMMDKYTEEELAIVGLVANKDEFKAADFDKITLTVEGNTFKFAYFDAEGNAKATSGRKRKPDVIQKALNDGTQDNYNVLKSKDSMVILGKYLIASDVELASANIEFNYDYEVEAAEEKSKKRKKVAPKYVFIENGKIRVWTGQGVAPLPMKEARHLAKKGFTTALEAFEISASEENLAMYEKYKEQEGNLATHTQSEKQLKVVN